MKTTKYKLGLLLLILSSFLYLCIPLVLVFPTSQEVKIGTGFISYIISWMLMGTGIYFVGKEGYEDLKFMFKNFFMKVFKLKKEK